MPLLMPKPGSVSRLSNIETYWLSGSSEPLKAGRWYCHNRGNYVVMSYSPYNGYIYLFPKYITTNVTIDKMAVWQNAAGSGNTHRLGIYSANQTTCRPSTLLVDAGTFTDSTGGAKEVTLSTPATLSERTLYFFAFSLSTVGAATFWSYYSSAIVGTYTGNATNGYSDVTTVAAYSYYIATGQGGTLPVTLPSLVEAGAEEISVKVRVASVF